MSPASPRRAGPGFSFRIGPPRRHGAQRRRAAPAQARNPRASASFANTRLRRGGHEVDESFATGVNAEFMPFHVRLRHRDGRVRWQPIMALVGLDNLYGDHYPDGMVIVNYGPTFHIKTEPETS